MLLDANLSPSARYTAVMTAQTYFVADIGATNARFALANGQGELERVAVVPTTQLGGGADFAQQVRTALAVDTLDGVCVALAGPVQAGQGKITNGDLALGETGLASAFGAPAVLANDFYALAHGVPKFAKLQQLGGLAAAPGVKAVLGAGSGLGMSLVVPSESNGWQVLASEGGYGDLACANELEQAVQQILQQRFDHVCWETVLSGPGLVHLYQALAELWGTKADDVTPEWITANGVEAQIPLCHQTLEMFFGFQGAAAGNLALTGYALGGVYIGGGIAPKLVEFAQTSGLRRRFDERGALSPLVQKIPLYIVLDQHPGLLGALTLLQRRLG